MSGPINADLDRRKYIGSSDVAAILGISPWRTALDVYLDKTQPPVEEKLDPGRARAMTRGKRMEPYVIDLLAEETGLPVFMAEDPATCVVRGCGMTLEQLERLSGVFTED